MNYGVDIFDDDCEKKDSFGNIKIDKETVVMCDRPCRIDKSDIVDGSGDTVIVSAQKYDEIVDGICHYVKEGKIRDEIISSS